MDLKEKINKLNDGAKAIFELTRNLNIQAAALSGVAATVPEKVPFPASHFKGCKVILRNVSYDSDAGRITATVTMPYVDPGAKGYEYKGAMYKSNITEDWFK